MSIFKENVPVRVSRARRPRRGACRVAIGENPTFQPGLTTSGVLPSTIRSSSHASERHRALSALLGVAARVMTKLTALLLVLGLHLAHAKFSRKNKQFLQQGGAEFAFMSTSTQLKVATAYSRSANGVLMKIQACITVSDPNTTPTTANPMLALIL